jgi:drug/metabolite transporter (DMT)-like permease
METETPTPLTGREHLPDKTVLTPRAALAMVGIMALWAGSSAAAKSGLDSFGPFTLTLLRSLPAGLLILALTRRQGPLPRVRPADRFGLFYLGTVGVALTYSIFYFGMRGSTSSDASLLFACEPLLIALIATLFLRERLSRGQWLGMLIGLAGVVLIVGGTFGNLIMLLAIFCETSTGIFSKKLTRAYPGLFVLAMQMLIGSAVLVPFALWEVLHTPPHITLSALGGALYLALICSAFCFSIWYRLMERYPISLLGAFILLQPLLGPVYGFLLHGEPFNLRSLFGGSLIIGGITLTTLIGSRKK